MIERQNNRSKTGIVFDIQRFAIHDGYGIRTLVFLKGCPLRCTWCSNPESQKQKPEVMFYEEKCIGCGACIDACPFGEELKSFRRDTRGRCVGCGKCVEVCYAEARKLIGRTMTVGEVLDVVLKDTVFYEESSGGLTIGGGEPSFQADFTAALLEETRRETIHTAVETCGFTPWDQFKKLLKHLDLLLFDLKHMDSEKHKDATGTGNEVILRNAELASEAARDMIIRIPLIPNFNNDPENLHALGDFVNSRLSGVRQVNILPYHSIGESKSERLGTFYGLHGLKPLEKEEIVSAKQILQSHGLQVKIGG